LITPVEKIGDEYSAMRRMVRIGGITQDIWIKVEARVVLGSSWLRTLADILQPTDLLFCPSERITPTDRFHNQLLSLFLSKRLARPVYLLVGFYAENHPTWPHWIRQIPFWIGCLLILVIFSFLEVDVSQMATGWVSQLILGGLVIVEICFLYLLNAMNG
jgi:hypothetical protein